MADARNAVKTEVDFPHEDLDERAASSANSAPSSPARTTLLPGGSGPSARGLRNSDPPPSGPRPIARSASPFPLPPPSSPRPRSFPPPPASGRGPISVPPPSGAPTSVPPSGAPGSGRTTPVPYIVLVALDLSEPGGRAWRFAFDLAELRGETEIHAVVVGTRDLAPRVRDLATSLTSKSARETEVPKLPPLKVLQHRSAGRAARLMAMHYRTGRPDKAIVSLAREIGADLIVVAKQETTRLERLLGGSTADRIARNAPCPVVVVKPKNEEEGGGISEFDPSRR